jgi:succinyl-CoA synthetase beta subunit
MLLYEHEGKALLAEHGIPVPRAALIRDATGIDAALAATSLPVMVKAQALTGGRGKAGGILPATERGSAEAAVRQLLGTTIKGERVVAALIEERAIIEREIYLAATIEVGCMILLVGAEGGIEVETRRDSLARIVIDPLYGLGDYQVRIALDHLGLPAKLWAPIADIAQKLFGLFRGIDATLAEINPLAVLADGTLLALDARIEVDEGAFFRQPRLRAIKQARPEPEGLLGQMQALDIQYVPVGGPIGLLSSGAGCGVTIMDWVAAEGSRLWGFVDIDYALLSGKTEDAMRLLVGVYVDDPQVRSIIVNFTTCGLRLDEIAGSLVAVLDGFGERLTKPVFVHLEGNRVAAGRERIRASRYRLCGSIGEAVREACRAAGGKVA